jgi:hypothetical protein
VGDTRDQFQHEDGHVVDEISANALAPVRNIAGLLAGALPREGNNVSIVLRGSSNAYRISCFFPSDTERGI